MDPLIQQICRSIEHLEVPFAMITPDLYIQYVSPLFATLLGYDVADLINQSYIPFFDIEWEMVSSGAKVPIIKGIAKKNGTILVAGFRMDHFSYNFESSLGYLVTLKLDSIHPSEDKGLEDDPFDLEAQLFVFKVTMQELVDPITTLTARLKTLQNDKSKTDVQLTKMTDQVEQIATIIRTVMPIIRRPDPIEWKKMIPLTEILWASEWLLKTYLKNKHVVITIHPNLAGVSLYCIYRKTAQFFIILLKVLLDNRLNFSHWQNIEFSFDRSTIQGEVIINIKCSFKSDILDCFLMNKKNAGINVLQGIAKALDFNFEVKNKQGELAFQITSQGAVKQIN